MTLAHGGRMLTVLAAVVAYLLTPAVGPSLGALAGSSFPDALVAVGTLVQVVVAWWILLVVALASMGSSSRLLLVLTPVVLRRALFVGAVGALAAAPSYAAESMPGGTHSVAGLQLPDRPDGSASRAAPTTPPPSGSDTLPAPTSVTVTPGDSLWGIAARSLPSDASAAQIVTETARWHRANRAVIGANPHVLFPGQQLTPPSGKDIS